MSVSGLTKIRDRNMLAIFQEVIQSDGILRSEISAKTGISLMTVGKIMDVLLKRNIIFEREHRTNTAGRKPAVAYPYTGKWWSCVFNLTDEISFYFLSLDLKVLYTESFPIIDNDWEGSMAKAILHLKTQIAEQKLNMDFLFGVGVSAGAPYNEILDRVACPKRPKLENLRVHALLEDVFHTDIYIDEDVKLAAVASLDSYQEYRDTNIFYMYVGIGVGGVLLVNSEIYRGSDNYAGDIGQVMFTDGTTVEDRLSWETLNNQLAAHEIDLHAPHVQDDATLHGIINDYANLLALSVYNAVCMYSPTAVIIDGKYSLLGDYFYDTFLQYYDDYFRPYERKKPKVHFLSSCLESSILGLGYQLRKKWLLAYNSVKES